MKMKVLKYIIGVALALSASSCSHISDDERLIYVPPVEVNRAVLIEDFTGQRCLNCPNATDEISRLQAQYGEDKVIAVGIHSGPLALFTNDRFVGLRTETGDEYFNYWNPEHQPIGVVNRHGLSDYVSWSSLIRTELQKKAAVGITIEVSADDGQLTVKTTVTGVRGNTVAKLQLWLTENNIKAFQMMPDGSRDDNYVHNHVFRAAVNGTWGEAISVREGETVAKEHTMLLHSDWNADNLSVVAFVYDDTGVIQVTYVQL